MHTEVLFLDCPAYTDQHGTTRCGLPAEVQYRYAVSSTDGPQEGAKIGCPRGHWFNGPIEALTLAQHPGTQHATTGHQQAWRPAKGDTSANRARLP